MVEGSCLCGKVAFEADALSGAIGHCHCRTCRKAHASSFSTTARVMRDQFRWVRGEEHLRHYESSPGKRRHFCSLCGTHLIAEWVDRPNVILRMGAVDTDPGQRPAGHIWKSHAVPWLSYGARLPMFAEGVDGPRVQEENEG